MTRKAIPVLLILGILSVSFVGVFFAEDAEAIPAFARKYRMSCTTCHQPAPRLKPYGDDFAGNGFELSDQEAPRYYVETGDDNLSLIREFPFAVRIEGWARHETRTGTETDLSLPYNLKLLSGGAIAKNLAYYFYFYLSEHGEVAGVEDAYIMFNNLFGKDFDIYLGQFQVSDPLFKREVRLTFEDYIIYTVAPGESQIDLKYDRGIMLTYGGLTGSDIVLEIVNGNGLVEAGGTRLLFDEDKYKNVVGRVSQAIVEYARIGAFGYYGKEAATNGFKNEVWMLGGDATVGYGPVELNLQYVERRDDNPTFAASPGDEIKTRGGMAECILWPHGDQSKWYAVALYNYVESDLAIGPYDQLTYNTITGHVGYLLHTNIRLTAENIYDIENEENSALVGIVAAF
jgi:hypothetical protein